MTIKTNPFYKAKVIGFCLFLLISCTKIPQNTNEHSPELLILFIYINEPFLENQTVLLKLLKQEEYEVFIEGEKEIVLLIDELLLKKLFQVKIKTIMSGASSSDAIIKSKSIESYIIPERFKQYINSIYFDPQRS